MTSILGADIVHDWGEFSLASHMQTLDSVLPGPKAVQCNIYSLTDITALQSLMMIGFSNVCILLYVITSIKLVKLE